MCCWRYDSGKENPPDIAFVGLSAKGLPDCFLLCEGPKLLSLSHEHLPQQPQIKTNSDIVNKEQNKSKFVFL